jgi:hypothetical protein
MLITGRARLGTEIPRDAREVPESMAVVGQRARVVGSTPQEEGGPPMSTKPRETYRETMCCSYKKCPEVVLFADGSAEFSDDDPEAGSVGTIRLRPEVVVRLKEILTGHG